MNPLQMTGKKLFAYLITGTMYAALLSGTITVIVVAWKFIPGIVIEMFSRGVIDGLIMITLMVVMAVLLMALGYLGASLTNTTFKGITDGWDKQ
jgi:hypothetical protein